MRNLELFDRVRIKDSSDMDWARGLEGTVAYVGSVGVSIVIEEIDEIVPVLWTEIEKIEWESYGE